MAEIRCVKCRRLLFKFNGGSFSDTDHKCPKCGQMNNVRVEREGIYINQNPVPVFEFKYDFVMGQERQRAIPVNN